MLKPGPWILPTSQGQTMPAPETIDSRTHRVPAGVSPVAVLRALRVTVGLFRHSGHRQADRVAHQYGRLPPRPAHGRGALDRWTPHARLTVSSGCLTRWDPHRESATPPQSGPSAAPRGTPPGTRRRSRCISAPSTTSRAGTPMSSAPCTRASSRGTGPEASPTKRGSHRAFVRPNRCLGHITPAESHLAGIRA